MKDICLLTIFSEHRISNWPTWRKEYEIHKYPSYNRRLSMMTPDISSLPYFDFHAQLGTHTMHSGGASATMQLLALGNLSERSRILEIGCGTGASTLRLIQQGYDVVVVESSAAMIAAMKTTCASINNASVQAFHHSAEDMHFIESGSIDAVLCECVLGFIPDIQLAIKEIYRVLKPGGYVLINDFHHIERPPLHITSKVKEIVSSLVEYRNKKDWLDLFNNAFLLAHWKDAPSSAADLKKLKQQRKLIDTHAQASVHNIKVLTSMDRIAAEFSIFNEYKLYLRQHIAVLQKADAC